MWSGIDWHSTCCVNIKMLSELYCIKAFLHTLLKRLATITQIQPFDKIKINSNNKRNMTPSHQNSSVQKSLSELICSVDFGGMRYGLNSVLVRPNILCILGATTGPFTQNPSILPCTAMMAFLMWSSSSAPCQLPDHLRFLISACSTVVSNARCCK